MKKEQKEKVKYLKPILTKHGKLKDMTGFMSGAGFIRTPRDKS